MLDKEKARVERDYEDELRQLERYQRHRTGGFLHGIVRVSRRLWSGWRIDVDEVRCFKNTPWNAGLCAAVGTEAGIVDERDRRARDFAKAACHVRRVNKKVMSFERGVRISGFVRARRLAFERFSSSFPRTASRAASGIATSASPQARRPVSSDGDKYSLHRESHTHVRLRCRRGNVASDHGSYHV
jgi:hypothetical protein